MIPRYSRPEMTNIWSQEMRFRKMLDVEILACDAMADIGEIPREAAIDIRAKADFDLKRIAEIEKETRHDVIAFLTNVGEYVGDNARFIHKGLTSSDVIDTGFSLQMIAACEIIDDGLSKLLEAFKKRIHDAKDMICIGRSHGIHGEPTSFGLKLASHYAAFGRAKERLAQAKKDISTCTLSGAMGSYATIDPRIESYVADKLNLRCETVATQIIPRDRHAFLVSVLAVIASSIENIAVEIRHLQRTEVREAEEFFHAGQKGSSAMPHKRNPVLTENLTGLARIIRAQILPALENVTLWHERDISHSSVERISLPDAFIALDFALNRLTGVIENLTLYPDAMLKNLNQTRGLVYSQRVMLALTETGMQREIAYKIVQDAAMSVWDNEDQNLFDTLGADPRLTDHINPTDLKDLFNAQYYIRHVDMILERVFQETE